MSDQHPWPQYPPPAPGSGPVPPAPGPGPYQPPAPGGSEPPPQWAPPPGQPGHHPGAGYAPPDQQTVSYHGQSPGQPVPSGPTGGGSGGGLVVVAAVLGVIVAMVILGGIGVLLTRSSGTTEATGSSTSIQALSGDSGTAGETPASSSGETTAPPDTGSNEPGPAPTPGDGSSFTYTNFGGTSWNGTITGLVEADLSDFAESDGRCLLVLGTLTPSAISTGPVTNGFEVPEISVLVDGRQVGTEFGNCDTAAVADAGYGWIFDATVTTGTSFPFYDEIFLPATNPAEPDSLVVGDPSTDDAVYFEPTVLDGPPVATPVVGERLTDLALATGAGSPFDYEDFGGTTWTGTITGLVEVPTGSFSNGDGRCLLLVGTVTPTAIADGSVSSGFETPTFSVMADGRQIRSGFAGCESGDVESAGYGWILDAEVTAGTAYPFYEEFLLSDRGPTVPDVIVVGDPSDDRASYYEATLLDSVPSP